MSAENSLARAAEDANLGIESDKPQLHIATASDVGRVSLSKVEVRPIIYDDPLARLEKLKAVEDWRYLDL
jgi:hypothetical protein